MSIQLSRMSHLCNRKRFSYNLTHLVLNELRKNIYKYEKMVYGCPQTILDKPLPDDFILRVKYLPDINILTNSHEKEIHILMKEAFKTITDSLYLHKFGTNHIKLTANIRMSYTIGIPKTIILELKIPKEYLTKEVCYKKDITEPNLHEIGLKTSTGVSRILEIHTQRQLTNYTICLPPPINDERN